MKENYKIWRPNGTIRVKTLQICREIVVGETGGKIGRLERAGRVLYKGLQYERGEKSMENEKKSFDQVVQGEEPEDVVAEDGEADEQEKIRR